MTPDAERMTEISDRLLDYQPAKKPWRVHYLEDVPWLLERLAAVRDEATREMREHLWSSHGHVGLYGDDGEMQCSACHADYLRDPVDALVILARKAIQEEATRVERKQVRRSTPLHIFKKRVVYPDGQKPVVLLDQCGFAIDAAINTTTGDIVYCNKAERDHPSLHE